MEYQNIVYTISNPHIWRNIPRRCTTICFEYNNDCCELLLCPKLFRKIFSWNEMVDSLFAKVFLKFDKI